MTKYRNGGLLCEEGEYTIALRRKSINRIKPFNEDEDAIPLESNAEENKKIPNAPGTNFISKITLEAAPFNVKKANTTPSRAKKKNEANMEEFIDSCATPRTPTMRINSSRFFEEDTQSHRLQISTIKDEYKAVSEKKYKGMNHLTVIK